MKTTLRVVVVVDVTHDTPDAIERCDHLGGWNHD